MKTTKPKDKLIYIMDPHCGWCFGNVRSISDVYDSIKDTFDFEILPGGMWSGKEAPRGGQAMKDFLLPNIIRLNHFANADIENAYIDLIQDSTYMLSSDWPSQAIITIKELYPDKVLKFTHALMNAQFQDGKRFDVERTYVDVLKSLDINPKKFINTWKMDEMKIKTEASYKKAKYVSTSFPSLVYQSEKGFKPAGYQRKTNPAGDRTDRCPQNRQKHRPDR